MKLNCQSLLINYSDRDNILTHWSRVSCD